MFGILGSGFGLYGYLPSIVANGGSVCLLEKAKEICNSRVETRECMDAIVWAADKEEFWKNASSLVVAMPPSAQFSVVQELLNNKNNVRMQQIILEKPLAPNPQQAQELLMSIFATSAQLRVGYIFRHALWLEKLSLILSAHKSVQISLDWFFKAHHITHNKETWKKYHTQGGGCLRFYAIHIIAILAYLNFTKILHSHLEFIAEDVPVRWQAEFNDANLNSIKIKVDICAANKGFKLAAHANSHLVMLEEYDDIFVFPQNIYHDVRSNFIDRVLKSFNEEDADFYAWYSKTNDLWANIENVTQNVRMSG